MNMTVQELIELLEDCLPEAEIRLASQPGWPLAFQLHGVVPDEDTASPTPSCGWWQVTIPTRRRTRQPVCGRRSDDVGDLLVLGLPAEMGRPVRISLSRPSTPGLSLMTRCGT